MKISEIFSSGVVRYLVYCYLFLIFTIGLIIMYGGGGHGPFVPLGWLLTLLFCMASFPSSLITLFGFMTGGNPEAVIPLLAISPILNAALIGSYLQIRRQRKISRRKKA
jgi:hypothetical protein